MDKPEDAGRAPDPPHYPGTPRHPAPQQPAAQPNQEQAANTHSPGQQSMGYEQQASASPGPISPPPPDPQAPKQRRLRRSHDLKVGGVAAGLGRYIGVEPNFFRVGFIALTLFGGSGLVIYLAAWLLLPSDDDPDPTPLALTSNTPALVIGFIVLAFGAVGLVEDEAWGLQPEIIIPAILVLVGIWVLNQRSETAAPPPPISNTTSSDPTNPSFVSDVAANHAQAKRQRARGAWPPSENHATQPLMQVPPLHVSAPDPVDLDEAPSGGPAPWDSASTVQPWAMTHPRVQEKKPAKTGPPVTSITLASAAVAIGLFLVLSNIAGIAISATAVLGAVLAIIGAGLVASAIFERALGLYPLGLLVLMMLVVAPLIDTTLGGGVGTREVRVTSVGALEPSYSIGMGELLLDLARLEPTEDVSVEVDVGAGYAEITVPPDVRVEVRARSRAGYVEAFRISDEGVLNDLYQVSEGADPEGPTLTIEADVSFGYVEVRRG